MYKAQNRASTNDINTYKHVLAALNRLVIIATLSISFLARASMTNILVYISRKKEAYGTLTPIVTIDDQLVNNINHVSSR